MGLLDSLFGGNRGSGSSPMTLALLAFLAYRAYQSSGGASSAGAAPANPAGPLGGLGSVLSTLFPGGAGAAAGGGLGDLLRGGLGGAAAGTLVNGWLNELIRQFQQNGHGDTARSWVGNGPNREITPNELESALGRDNLEALAKQTDKPYMEVLSELSQGLPDAVDKMTPEGRVPTHEEAAKLM